MHSNCLHMISRLALAAILLSGCAHTAEREPEAGMRIPVTLEKIRMENMSESIELKAISRFLDISVINSPATAFVEKTSVDQGDFVNKGDLLVTLKTREATALQRDSANTLSFSGIISVRSNLSGIITSLDHPDGDFVQEGDQLGVIAIPGSLVFILEVPYEYISKIRLNTACTINLPGGNSIAATITAKMPSVSKEAQTQQYLVRPSSPAGLPENLIGHVSIPSEVRLHTPALPKSCVLSDEIMQHFWVMKMVGDTMAVRVPVKPGITARDRVEILDPVFDTADRFLASGNYGLGDTAYVRVVTEAGHGK
jgi:biotin carboxyl carrier protein